MVWAETNNGTGYLFNVGQRWGWRSVISYDATSREWPSEETKIFAGTDGYGGVSAQQNGSITQLKIVNESPGIIDWVRDPDNTTDPDWIRQPDPVSGIWPNSSLAAPHIGGDGTLLYYQSENASIALVTSSEISENATWGSQTDLGIHAMGGTALHVSSVELQAGGGQSTVLFLQETGNDITVYVGSPTDLRKNGTLPL